MQEEPAVASRPSRDGTGFTRVIAATAIGGVAGYLITWLVPRVIGFASYAEFAAFWGLLFFLVSALSGIQQEVTRATNPVKRGSHANAFTFGLGATVGVVVVLIASAFLWSEALYAELGWTLVWPTVIGAASYVSVAVVGGTLYGLGRWNAVFWLVATEATLRLAAIVAVLALTTDVVAIAWAVALPFPVTLAVLAVYLFRRIRGRSELDVSYAALSWNVARTIVAAASMGLLISGMPALLRVAGRGESDAFLGLVIITMTLTRAPLIVVAMALQSYFIVLFKNAGSRFWRTYLGLSGVVALGGLVLAAIGYALGPWVFSWLFPVEATPSAGLIAGMVLSSAFVGLLCVSAPAVLARSQHVVYSTGWLVAAIVTVLVLVLPIGFEQRMMLALFLGPIAGLAVHWTYLAIAARHGVAAARE